MKKLPDTISESECRELIKAAKSNKFKLALALGFWQCLRVSEVIHLQKQDVDSKRGFIHIKQGKGKKDRDIPLQEQITSYLRFLPVDVTRQALHQAIKKLGNQILHKPLHFHILRHSGATYYLNQRKVDIRFIKDFLGHSRLSTTELYTHVNPEQLKQAFGGV